VVWVANAEVHFNLELWVNKVLWSSFIHRLTLRDRRSRYVDMDYFSHSCQASGSQPGVHGPQGFTEGFLGIHGLYMYKMKAKQRNAKLRAVMVQLAKNKLSLTVESRVARSRWTKNAKSRIKCATLLLNMLNPSRNRLVTVGFKMPWWAMTELQNCYGRKRRTIVYKLIRVFNLERYHLIIENASEQYVSVFEIIKWWLWNYKYAPCVVHIYIFITIILLFQTLIVFTYFEIGTKASDMLDMSRFHKIFVTKCSRRELTEKLFCVPGTDGQNMLNLKMPNSFNKRQAGWNESKSLSSKQTGFKNFQTSFFQ